MKKMILTAILGTTLLSASAQVIQKGQRMLGGSFNLGFSATDPDEDNVNYNKQTNWSVGLAPSFAKARKDNRVFGYRLLLNASGAKYENSTPSVTKNYARGVGAGIFWERFLPITRQLYFSLPVNLIADYQFIENRQSGTFTEILKRHTYGVSIGVDPTISYSLNRKFLLQLSTPDFASVYVNKSKEKRSSNILPVREDQTTGYGIQSILNNNYSLNSLSLSVRYIF